MITGASRGLGAEIAKADLAAGNKLSDRNGHSYSFIDLDRDADVQDNLGRLTSR